MSVTFGFYNSLNGDRKYNAEQVSSIFDGIVQDGVFASIGKALMVKAGTGMQVLVQPGRAWFDHTWTLNDADLPLTIDPADMILKRIDAVVLEVDATMSVRTNTIKVVKGQPDAEGTKPALTNTETVHQHALAYITVAAAAESIDGGAIENVIGKEKETPFVTSICESVSIEDLFSQWTSQFNNWFDNVKAQLEGNIVTNLQRQIEEKVDKSDKASSEEAVAGEDNNKYMTPSTTKESVDNRIGYVYPIGSIRFGQLPSDVKGTWVRCDGGGYNKNTYPELYKIIGYDYTFVVSDYMVNGIYITDTGYLYGYNNGLTKNGSDVTGTWDSRYGPTLGDCCEYNNTLYGIAIYSDRTYYINVFKTVISSTSSSTIVSRKDFIPYSSGGPFLESPTIVSDNKIYKSMTYKESNKYHIYTIILDPASDSVSIRDHVITLTDTSESTPITFYIDKYVYLKRDKRENSIIYDVSSDSEKNMSIDDWNYMKSYHNSNTYDKRYYIESMKGYSNGGFSGITVLDGEHLKRLIFNFSYKQALGSCFNSYKILGITKYDNKYHPIILCYKDYAFATYGPAICDDLGTTFKICLANSMQRDGVPFYGNSSTSNYPIASNYCISSKSGNNWCLTGQMASNFKSLKISIGDSFYIPNINDAWIRIR